MTKSTINFGDGKEIDGDDKESVAEAAIKFVGKVLGKSDIHEDTIDLATETLTGDIRDYLLDRVKTQGKPWAAMTEDEQSAAIHAARDAADNLVKRAVKIIAAEGRQALVGNLVKVQIKDAIQCQVDFSKTDALRHELFDAQGQAVLLVVADAAPFKGERAPAEPTADQSDLIANAERLKGSDGKVTTLK